MSAIPGRALTVEHARICQEVTSVIANQDLLENTVRLVGVQDARCALRLFSALFYEKGKQKPFTS